MADIEPALLRLQTMLYPVGSSRHPGIVEKSLLPLPPGGATDISSNELLSPLTRLPGILHAASSCRGNDETL